MEMTHDEKVAMFKATVDDMQARANFAASRADVILPLLDEQSTVRSIFLVEDIGSGTPIYDIPFDDIECVWTMPGIGAIPTIQVEGRQISCNTFGIDGGVDYQMDVARDGRIQVAELATNLLKNKVIAQEELAGWGLIKNHAAVLPSEQKLQAFADNGTTQTAGQGKMNLFTVAEAITMADEIGIGGRRITDIFVSPRRFNDLRMQVGNGSQLPDDLRVQLWGNGAGQSNVGGIRIHKVYNRLLVPNNKAYAFTQKEGFTYGRMPIREKWNTRDNPIAVMEWKIGVIGRARFGFCVQDDKGLIEITY